MARSTTLWLFSDKYTGNPKQAGVWLTTEKAIEELTKLAEAFEASSKYKVLEEAPGLYEGPLDEAGAVALNIEAAATWLWAQLYGGPDRNALLDMMSN